MVTTEDLRRLLDPSTIQPDGLRGSLPGYFEYKMLATSRLEVLVFGMTIEIPYVELRISRTRHDTSPFFLRPSS